MSDDRDQNRQWQENVALGTAAQQVINAMQRTHRQNEQSRFQNGMFAPTGAAQAEPAAMTYASGDLQRITTTGLAVSVNTTTEELVAQTAGMQPRNVSTVDAHAAPPATTPDTRPTGRGLSPDSTFF